MNYGYHPRDGFSSGGTGPSFVEDLGKIHEEAKAALQLANDDMKRFYDAHKGKAVEYAPGDLVLLEGTNLKTTRPMKKFDQKRFGPFKIIKRVGASSLF